MRQLYDVGTRVNHPQFGVGIITKVLFGAYEITFPKRGQVEVSDTLNGIEITDEVFPSKDKVSLKDITQTLEGILKKWGEVQEPVDLGSKWEGGTLVLKPANPNLKAKEIPIETFFHKIVMVRDRLRVMEQRINSSQLTDEEKVNLQQYISRIYGSLTTFNVLFDNKEDHFSAK